MKIAVYCRIGNAEQSESKELIGYKKKLVENFRKRNHIEGKLKYYMDLGYSGRNLNRPKLNCLIKDIENRQINTVIVKNIEQLFREHIEYLNFYKDIIKPYNIKIICMDYNYSEEHESYDRLSINILEALRDAEIRDIKNKQKMRFKK